MSSTLLTPTLPTQSLKHLTFKPSNFQTLRPLTQTLSTLNSNTFSSGIRQSQWRRVPLCGLLSVALAKNGTFQQFNRTFSPNGVHAGEFYDNWDDLPAPCFESGQKPYWPPDEDPPPVPYYRPSIPKVLRRLWISSKFADGLKTNLTTKHSHSDSMRCDSV